MNEHVESEEQPWMEAARSAYWAWETLRTAGSLHDQANAFTEMVADLGR